MAQYITGLEDTLKCLDAAPANALRIGKKAMRAGANASAREIRRATPQRWRRLVKSKLYTLATGETSVSIGFFNGHQRSGHQNKNAEIDDWFKAYWANYGTLKHRDRSHKFKNPVKHGKTAAATRRRNNEGQVAQRFFDEAVSSAESRFTAAFEQSVQTSSDDIYRR